MDLPRPKDDNIYKYSALLARMSAPLGVGYHRPARGRLWRTKVDKREYNSNVWKSTNR